jgi:Zn-dependent alcohol dehydrogenase
VQVRARPPLSQRAYHWVRFGFQLPGCFAEYAVLPEIALVHVDDCISDSEAACLQSLSDSVAAIETAGIRLGDSIAIFGVSSMGLESMQTARVSGAGRIIAIDVREESSVIARELRADHVVNAAQDDPSRLSVILRDHGE